MRTGWEIVIAGRNFDPWAFLANSKIQPDHLGRRISQEMVVEFTDWRDGVYPLDMVMEALDYLRSHRDEFQALCGLPGIEERCLNFIGEPGADYFEFSPGDLSLLASLGLSVSIGVPK